MELAGPITAPCDQYSKRHLFTKFEPSSSKTDQDTDVNIQKTKRDFWTSKITCCFFAFFSESAITFERLELACPINVPCYQHCKMRLSTKFGPSSSKTERDTHAYIHMIFGSPKSSIVILRFEPRG